MRKIALVLAISTAMLTACNGPEVPEPGDIGVPGETDTTFPAGGESQSAAALAEMQAELALFAAEVQAVASAELGEAWNQLNFELGELAVRAQQEIVSEADIERARQAVDRVTTAVQENQEQLSAAFQEFWAEFTTRFELVVGS